MEYELCQRSILVITSKIQILSVIVTAFCFNSS